MSDIALSVPGVVVNNIPITIVPNTLKYSAGFGEQKTRAGSTGGGGVETVHTENAESKIGKIMFDMFVTTANEKSIRGWKSNIGKNSITLQQPGQDPRSMGFASMVNEPEFDASAEGVVSVEFEGAPLSSNYK